jgi:hypothetical protein
MRIAVQKLGQSRLFYVRTLVGVLGIYFWVQSYLISSKLRPIADEICVLGEWKEGEPFPELYLSPRLFSSLFTWSSAVVWEYNYQLGLCLHYVVIVFMIANLYKHFNKQIQGTRSSKVTRLVVAFILTPYLLFALPLNTAAIYDSVFWFGGTWHVIGAIITVTTVLVLLNHDSSVKQQIIWSLLSGAWSEISAGMTCITIILLLMTRAVPKVQAIKLFLAPSFFFLFHVLFNLHSGRLSSTQTNTPSAWEVSLKSVILVLSEFAFSGVIIGVILLFMLPNVNDTKKIFSQKLVLDVFLSAFAFVFLISFIAYPTWRGSYFLGLVSVFLTPFLLRVKKTNSMRFFLPLLIGIFLISINSVNNLQIIEKSAQNRLTWWNSISMTQELDLPLAPLPHANNILPADYGSAEWVDKCFKKFLIRDSRGH